MPPPLVVAPAEIVEVDAAFDAAVFTEGALAGGRGDADVALVGAVPVPTVVVVDVWVAVLLLLFQKATPPFTRVWVRAYGSVSYPSGDFVNGAVVPLSTS